jgi:hypothetical protein
MGRYGEILLAKFKEKFKEFQERNSDAWLVRRIFCLSNFLNSTLTRLLMLFY